MSSATPFRFSDASELLAQSGHIPQYLYTSQLGGQSESPGEGRSISAGESTVTSLKTENWTNTSTDHQTLETCRLRLSGQEASHSNIDRLALLASVASESVFSSGSSAPSFTTNMSTYISGSNGQAEALQTLRLMNTNYTGYGDSSSSGNMVLFSPGTGAVGGQGSPLGSSDHQHQQPHFARYGLSPGVTQTSYSHPSHIAAMTNTELAHQSTATDFYSKRTSSQGYNWAGGNEFSFLSPGHVAESDQRISTHMNLVKTGQLTASDMSHFGVGSLNGSAYHEQAPLFTNSMAAHGVNMDNLHAPSGAGHILSLSLSPQQPSMIQQLHSFSMQHNEPAANFFHGLSNAGSDNVSKEGVFSNKCAGDNVGGSFTVPSCDNMSGMGFQHPNTGEHRHCDILANQLTVGSYGSRYLKPAQELLNEVVSVGRGLRVNVLKRPKPQSWTGPSSASDGTFIKTMNVVDAPSQSIISWSGGKEGEPIVTAMPINIAGIPEQTMETVVELSSADRQELQAKRAKLVGMRDEVDRRYKQYYHQMQVVATSFESAAGLGAAAAYTALALQTISKHFRCLRDAISGQIQVTCKALGEDEVSGLARGETSKLRFIDQQLRQQHALRQLGMMQQQAWRPQRGLPEHSVSILRAWLFEHFLHPYPKDADKIMLAKQTGLHRNQVSNWFINARVRLWKPMVEEMYLEETKEGDADRADKSGGNEGDPGEEEMAGVSDGGPNSEFSKPFKQAKLSDEDRQAFGDVKGSSSYSSDMLQGRILVSSPSDNLLFHEKDGMRQGVMKLRHASQDASSLLSGTGIDYKSNKANGEAALESENKIRSDDSYKEQYNVPHNGFVQAEHLNLAGYASSYQINGMNRYGQESFGTSYAANGGVSLTLGLQHCEGLSFSGGQQHYSSQGGTAHLMTSRREDDGVGSADYYNVNENSYEVLGLQSRKPFPTHMLCHDFVV